MSNNNHDNIAIKDWTVNNFTINNLLVQPVCVVVGVEGGKTLVSPCYSEYEKFEIVEDFRARGYKVSVQTIGQQLNTVRGKNFSNFSKKLLTTNHS